METEHFPRAVQIRTARTHIHPDNLRTPGGVDLGVERFSGGCGFGAANWGYVNWGDCRLLVVSEIFRGVWVGQLGGGVKKGVRRF
jgi:hypothetical protein